MIRRYRILSLIILCSAAHAATYTTTFPATENPISEGGKWVGGSTAGGSLWGNVQTTPGLAFGVSLPTQFGDPTAILTGTWGPNQTVQGTVQVTGPITGGCCREIELRLRNTISTNSISGYEAYCSILSSNPYCHIARWNGANGSYCNIETGSSSNYAHNGDVLKATITGTSTTVITLFRNGTQELVATDTGQSCSPGGAGGPFTSGTPGIGFYDQTDNNWSDWGFTYFGATDDSHTYFAQSCSRTDVNAVINGGIHTAVDGDTILVPAGSCTWTSSVAAPSNIGLAIEGSGTPASSGTTSGASSTCSSTIITDNISTSGAALLSMSPTIGNSLSRISCMKLLPTVPNPGFGSPLQILGTCSSSGCPSLRIDNITAPSTWAANGIADDTFVIPVNLFGVADHNTIGDTQPASNGIDFLNPAHASWKGVGSYGDNSWATADTFGTVQTFYAENNVLNFALITDSDTNLGTGGGARFVCRFNTVNSVSTGGGCSAHGTDTTGRARGARQVEVYGNTGTCTNASQGCSAFGPGRSSVSITFGNSFTNSGGGFFKGMSTLDAQRRWRPDSPWGACDGTSAWDVNDGTTYFSGTVSAVTSSSGNYTITAGSPGWTTNQWQSNGSPYAFVDVTQSFGYEIASNTSNSLTTYQTGNNFGVNVPTNGDSIQILRSTVCMDQPSRGAGFAGHRNYPDSG